MVSTSDFKNGLTIEMEGNIVQIMEFQHVKPGKGAAFVRVKIKNLKTGSIVEKTLRPQEKFSKAHIEHLEMQYLYGDGEFFHFMNNTNFEQIALTVEEVGESLKFVKENDIVKMLSHEEKVFGIEPQLIVELQITETEPGHRGDTAQGGATKPATVETGARVNVPLFVDNGTIIKIDTRTGEYVGRV